MKKALIVVDMQEDFINGSLGCDNARAILDSVKQRVAACKQDGYDLFFTRDIHSPDYLTTQEGRNLPIVHCQAGDIGSEIVGELQEYIDSDTIIIDKSGFGSMELATALQQGHYEQVEICGLVTNICVLFAAVFAKTALPEAEIVVDEHYTASYDQALHAKTLDVLAGAQVTVIRV